MNELVVDYFGPHDSAFMRCLAENGVAGVARYLTNTPTDPRQITAQEVVDAHAAGLEVHFFFEMDPTRAEYFTFAQGAEDCRQAIERLRELGAPHGVVVYFAVDAPPSRIPPGALDEYFNGVESMQTPQLTPGIYGFEAHVEHARENYPRVGRHLAQTYGTPRGPLELWQHEQVALCGVAVDLNTCTVAGWRPKEERVDHQHPVYQGESVAVVITNPQDPDPEKRVARCSATWRYPNGRVFMKEEKFVAADAPVMRPVVLFPPIDPDSDPTQDLCAQPGVFIVVATTLGTP